MKGWEEKRRGERVGRKQRRGGKREEREEDKEVELLRGCDEGGDIGGAN